MSRVEHLSKNLDRLAGVKVVYTDLDGTMLGRNGSFLHTPEGHATTDAVAALLAAMEAGIDVVPASGRALPGLVTDARILGLSTVIAEMGALIAYEHGQVIVENFGPTPEGDRPVRHMERSGAIDLLLSRYEGDLEYHAPWHTMRDCTQLFRGRIDADPELEARTAELDNVVVTERPQNLGWADAVRATAERA